MAWSACVSFPGFFLSGRPVTRASARAPAGPYKRVRIGTHTAHLSQSVAAKISGRIMSENDDGYRLCSCAKCGDGTSVATADKQNDLYRHQARKPRRSRELECRSIFFANYFPARSQFNYEKTSPTACQPRTPQQSNKKLPRPRQPRQRPKPAAYAT